MFRVVLQIFSFPLLPTPCPISSHETVPRSLADVHRLSPPEALPRPLYETVLEFESSGRWPDDTAGTAALADPMGWMKSVCGWVCGCVCSKQLFVCLFVS